MAPRTIAKVDETQAGCVQVARGIGAYVYLTHQMGKGFPDGVVWYRGRVFFVEFKTDKGELTEDEAKVHAKVAEQGGAIYVIRTPGEMLRLLTAQEFTEVP